MSLAIFLSYSWSWNMPSYLVDVNRRRRRLPVEKCSLPFSTGRRRRSTSTAAFFSVDVDHPAFFYLVDTRRPFYSPFHHALCSSIIVMSMVTCSNVSSFRSWSQCAQNIIGLFAYFWYFKQEMFVCEMVSLICIFSNLVFLPIVFLHWSDWLYGNSSAQMT